MNTWAKYSVSFFFLVLVLSALIFVFGPWPNRQSYEMGQSPVGQLPADASLQSGGVGVTGTTSGTVNGPSNETTSGTTSAPSNAPIITQPETLPPKDPSTTGR